MPQMQEPMREQMQEPMRAAEQETDTSQGWEAPSFDEIKMDAEIGAYQGDEDFPLF